METVRWLRFGVEHILSRSTSSSRISFSPDDRGSINDWRTLHIWTSTHALELFGVDRGLIQLFRQLLAEDSGDDVCRMSDRQVLDVAARWVATQRWTIVRRHPRQLDRKWLHAPQVETVAAGQVFVSPSKLLSKGVLPVAIPSAITVSSGPDLSLVAHIIQASVLKRAAISAVSFCEVCERARQS